MKLRALACVRVVLIHDSYSRNIMLNALSSTEYQKSVEFVDLEKSTRMARISSQRWILSESPVYRHCNEQGQVIHCFARSKLRDYEKEPSKPECRECATEHELIYSDCDLLRMDCRCGDPPERVFPIFAGYLANGKKGYVAANDIYPQIGRAHV